MPVSAPDVLALTILLSDVGIWCTRNKMVVLATAFNRLEQISMLNPLYKFPYDAVLLRFLKLMVVSG